LVWTRKESINNFVNDSPLAQLNQTNAN
jgi:hypothetical protein